MSKKFRFTMEKLEVIPTPTKRTVYYDISQPGLRLLVTPTGNKSFQFQMWSKKLRKPLTKSLGKFRTISLPKVRESAATLITELNSGIDIERVHTESNRTIRLEPTVKDFSKVFIERYCIANQLRSVNETQRILNKEICPEIGKLKMSAVKKADIISLLDNIQDRGAPIMCNRTLSVLSKMFNFATERDVLAHSPVYGIKKRGVEAKRDRILSNEEIYVLWKALNISSCSMLIKFLLLTGQRTGEARQLEWSEINKEVWQIPASKTKTKCQHIVPLSTGALEIINQMRLVSNDRYVFPGKKNGLQSGECCLGQKSAARHFQRAINKYGWERTTVHDLRRTMRSKLAEIGVPPIVSEKILNHKLLGIISIYDHHDYLNEKCDALQKWSDYLQNLLKEHSEID